MRFLATCVLVVGLGFTAYFWFEGGHTVEAFLNALIPYLTAEWFAPLFSAILAAVGLAIGLAYLLLYFLPTIWVATAVSRQLANAREIDTTKLANDLSKSTDLKDAWRGFEQTLKTNDDNQVITSSRPARQFFNGRIIRASNVGHQFFPTLSGVFVGIGLLLTFLGLLAALNAAAGSVASADVKEAQAGLQALLRAATFKFWTSIAGLFVSICLGVWFRFLQSSFDHRIDVLAANIERKIPLETSDALARETTNLQREQLDQLRKFNTEIAFTIGTTVSKALEQGIQSSLASTFAPIIQRLEEISAAITLNSEAGFSGLKDQVTSSISDATNPHLQNLHNALQSFTAVISKYDGSAENLSGLVATQSELLKNTGLAAKAFEGISADIERISNPLTETVRHLTIASEELGKSTSAAAGVFDRAKTELQGIYSSLSGLVTNMDAVYGKHEERFESLDKSLDQALTKFGEHVSSITENVAKYVQEVDKGVASALQSLGAATEQMTEAADEIAEGVNKMANQPQFRNVSPTAAE